VKQHEISFHVKHEVNHVGHWSVAVETAQHRQIIDS